MIIYNIGDTVEVICDSAWTGEVGTVCKVTPNGQSIWLRVPTFSSSRRMYTIGPFCPYELKHSQEKLL